MTLVLDWGDGTLGSPVSILEVLWHGLIDDDVLSSWDDGSEVGAGELFLGEVGELVDTLVVAPAEESVVGVDLGNVLVEDSLSEGLLEGALELETVLSHVFLEISLGGLGGGLVEEDGSQ